MQELLITITGLPPGLNKLMGRHWSANRREKQLWYLLLRQAIGRNMRSFPGRVAIIATTYRIRLLDPMDNKAASFKFIGDALVHYEIIRDDGPEIVDEEKSAYRQVRVRHKNEQRIEVRIVDLE